MAKNTNPNAIARNRRYSRDAILASRDNRFGKWGVTLDSGATLQVLYFHKAAGVGFAISMVTDLVYLVVQTGEAKISPKVRVAVYAAHDDGTDKLSFATDRIGGYVNVGLFRTAGLVNA